MSDFDDYVITKELYDKLLSGKYVLKATLYDTVEFIGFPNWLDDSNDNTLSNALVDTHLIMPYWDTANKGIAFLIIGQLKDERYFLLCNNTSQPIINE